MNKKVMIIIIAVLVLIIIGGGAVAFMLISNSNNAEKPVELFTYETGDAFTTNTKDGDGLVKAQIFIVSTEEGIQADLDMDNAAIRNTIIFAIKNMTLEEVSSPEIETKLSEVVCAELNEMFDVDHFQKLYFGEYIVQPT